MTTVTSTKYASYPTTKRTNSLGWAQSDCHTCSSLRRACDRRRPRCDACTADKVICGGYVQKLDWRRGARSKLPALPQTPMSSTVKPASFTFVLETGDLQRPPKRRKSASSARGSAMSPSDYNSVTETETTMKISSVALSRITSDTTPILYQSIFNIYQLPRSILELVSFYESRFSYTTLTFMVKVNPWHACLAMIHEAPCVRDAVAAVAKRQRAHLLRRYEDVEVLELKARALCSFSAELGRSSPDTLISTTLALIGLEYTETAYSDWNVHLSGAYRVLEAAGGIALAEQNSTLRSQVAMLVWYDITAALLSRHGPVFPRSYIEALVEWQSGSGWSLLALNGCPDSLFLDIHDIASAAANAESLGPEEVEQLELGLWQARADEADGSQVACLVDAWRIGLLLYCERVFHANANPEDSAAKTKNTLAEEVLWLMSALPDNSTCQKQCLLPVLLAGCELTAEQLRFRAIAANFCSRWKEATGIWIFGSALNLLERVWDMKDAALNHNEVWWGCLISTRSSRGYLFG